MMKKQTRTVAPLWAIPAMDSFISTVNKKNDAYLFRHNIKRLVLALNEEGIRGWTEIVPGQIWRFFKGRPFWHFRGVDRFLNFIGLNELAPFANERNVKRILDASEMELPDATLEESFDAEIVKKASKEILQEMVKVGYCKTCIFTSHRVYLDLFLFLDANSLTYTTSLWARWFNEMKRKHGKTLSHWTHSVEVLEAVLHGISIHEAVCNLYPKSKSHDDIIPS